jgi:hypothetical protein
LKLDRTRLFNPKRRHFVFFFKKRGPDDALSGRCSLSSPILPEMTAQRATFKVHLMPYMSMKIDKKNMHQNGHLTSLYPRV